MTSVNTPNIGLVNFATHKVNLTYSIKIHSPVAGVVLCDSISWQTSFLISSRSSCGGVNTDEVLVGVTPVSRTGETLLPLERCCLRVLGIILVGNTDEELVGVTPLSETRETLFPLVRCCLRVLGIILNVPTQGEWHTIVWCSL